jgi:AbrB family looped-hinge helix DNA binding protein
MKQYNTTVLGKGQLVIPKEFRDELGIDVGDNLNCFIRGSAIILKKKIKTTTYSSMDDS